MCNNFKLCLTHFYRWGEKNFAGGFSLPGYGPGGNESSVKHLGRTPSLSVRRKNI